MLSGSRAICLLVWLVAASPVAAQTCAPPTTANGPVARIRDRLEIELVDGRLVKLLHIAPFEANPRGAARSARAKAAMEVWLGTQDARLPGHLPPADRWGRLVTPVANDQGENIGLRLVAEGLARVSPAQSDECLGALLAAEDKARNARLGLWADSHYGVLAAQDSAAFAAHAGEFVIAQGRVQRVGQTSARFYFDLGPVRSHDLSVTFSRHNAKAFAEAGIVPEKLNGQMIRVRGVIELRPGPLIEIFTPAAIERIGPKQ